MKSKILLGGFALSLMFTACSEEELVKNVSDTLDGRPVVGEVVLGVSNAAETRWTGGNTFEQGVDVIGACLMDSWSWDDINNKDVYTITNNVFTNYKFAYTEDGQWKSDALFSEGNYFFYMQYNEDMRGRGGLYDTIPAIQYVGESGNDAYLDNQLFLGYRFISKEDKDLNIDVDMFKVYAFPNFSIKYDGTNGVKIEKVVFSDTNFKLERYLDAATAINAGAYVPYEGADEIATNLTIKEYLKAYDDAKEGAAEAEKTLNAPVAQIAAAMKSNASAKEITMFPAESAGTVTGSIVVPAGTYGDIDVTIYTNKGIVNATVPAESIVDAVKKRHKVAYEEEPVDAAGYIEVDASLLPAALACGEGGSTKQVNISFKDGAIEVGNSLTVSTIEELENYLTNWYAGKRTETFTSLAVTLTADITLTKTVADFLANTTNNPTVSFTGTDVKLTVPAALDATVLNTLNTALPIVLEGDQTLDVVANKSFGAITNKGVLTMGITNGIVPTYTISTLDNEGTVNISNVADFSIETLNNYATLNVSKNANIAALTNGTEDDEDEEAALSITGATITGNVTNWDDIQSTGTSSITGTFTNNGSITVSDNLHLATVTQDGTMTIKGIVGVSVVLTNSGTIINEGRLMYNGGEINNAATGTINHKAGMYTYVNENLGTIIINEANPAQLSITDNTSGIVQYTATDADFDTSNTPDKNQLKSLYSEITDLIIEKQGDVKLRDLGANVTNLTFQNAGSANIAFAVGEELTSLVLANGAQTITNGFQTTSLKISGGNKILSGAFTVIEYFEVAQNVNVDIYANFTYNGNETTTVIGDDAYVSGAWFANYGNIFMNGGTTLAAPEYKKTAVKGDASRIYGTVNWEP